jgi:hypothetical protein
MPALEFEQFKKEKKFLECVHATSKFHMLDKDYFTSKNP